MKPIIAPLCIMILGISLITPLSSAGSNDRRGSEFPKENEVPTVEPPVDIRPSRQQQEPAPTEIKPEKKKSLPVTEMPVYRPPLRSAPIGRVAGGTRGVGDELPFLCVLAPDHTGLTVQQQPVLYWFLSQTTKHIIEFTLIEDQGIYPFLETRLPPLTKPGIQCIRIADYHIKLQQDVQYKWFVAIVPDPSCRSKDIIAGGAIQYIESPNSLHAKLAAAGEKRTPHIYAEAGLWYDALSAISDLVDAEPKDQIVRRQRASLLGQVGLPEVARFEMQDVIRKGQ